MAKKKIVRRRKRITAKSVGLSAPETGDVQDAAARALTSQIVEDGGAALAVYREPFGGTPAVLAALPIDRVEPTPYQRDPSEPHVKRLMTVIETLGRFLDPIITVRHDDNYWTPNGNHRLQAMRKLGAKSIIALVVPDPDVAFKILALNTEKAHNLKEKSLETIRMLRALAEERGGEYRARARLRIRPAILPHAWRGLRAPAAPERRRVQFRPAPHRRVPRRAPAARPEGAHAARRSPAGDR